jgi:hypothetical protein
MANVTCPNCGAFTANGNYCKNCHPYTGTTPIGTFKTNTTSGKRGGSSSGGGGVCFIATATLGSNLDPRVVELRKFRDNTLQRQVLGRLFITTYYSVSPTFARFIEKSQVLKWLSLQFLVGPAATIARKCNRNHPNVSSLPLQAKFTFLNRSRR